MGLNFRKDYVYQNKINSINFYNHYYHKFKILEGVGMKIKVLLILISIILISILSISCFSGVITNEEKEYINEFKVIKQEFIDKSSEQGISMNQKVEDLKEIRRDLIRLGTPQNEKLKEAQELCFQGMDKALGAWYIMQIIENAPYKDNVSNSEMLEASEKTLKIMGEAVMFFRKVDTILEDIEK